MAKIDIDIKDYICAPRSIVFAQDLTSAEKIILLILIDKCLTMGAFDKLQGNGSFYITGKDIEMKMDIKKNQILKRYLPKLVSKGYINKAKQPENVEGVYKTYSYFTLNWDAILNHKGVKKDEEVQAMRAAKAEKIKTRQPKKQVEVQQYPMEEEISGEYECGYDDYDEYCRLMEQEERQKEQEQAERQRAAESKRTQHEQQQSVDLAEITIQDDFEDDATIDIRVNGDLYNAGAQWWGYM